MSIGQQIKRYLKETGRTQAYLCKETGLSASAVSLVLSDRRRLRLDEYCAICAALELDPAGFLDAGGEAGAEQRAK